MDLINSSIRMSNLSYKNNFSKYPLNNSNVLLSKFTGNIHSSVVLDAQPNYQQHLYDNPGETESSFTFENVVNKIDNIDSLKLEFSEKQRIKIDNFLNSEFAELLYKQTFIEKNWVLSTGINKVKYEKPDIPKNDKINQAQLKNVNDSFGKGDFTYQFYRTMNNKSASFIEYVTRKIISSPEFINMLNEITGLNLTKINTIFMSKYKAGNFLSPHSDKGNGKLAFVINLSKFWKPQYGGNLHFLNDERTEIIDTYVPNFNNIVLFHVPKPNGIPHYVSHVSPAVKLHRLAISGWYE
jgi:Rps23 Pro-64 3,4-dihydroxylase Tpa1-like proline 4-hydroxylase